MPYPRIHDPPLYQSELNSTLTRYEYNQVWPSRSKLHVEFSVLAAVNAVVSAVVLVLIISLLRSKKLLSNPFNLYLLFIAIPDFLVSFLCLITCAMSAPRSQFYSEAMCGFQSFYLYFAFISNAWLNGVIVFQIHRLLRNSNVRRRYIPPTHKQVICHAAAVYIYALIWGFLCAFNLPFLPLSSHLYYGFACSPMMYDRASSFFFWLAFIPFLLGVPLVYAAYVVIDIWKNKLLPPTGRRRKLSMFLLRLCSLYFLIWLPFLVTFLMGNFVLVNQNVHWVGALISHLQGCLSACFCFTNEEIRYSAYLFFTCQPADLEKEAQSPTDAGRGTNSQDYSEFLSRQFLRWSRPLQGTSWRTTRASSGIQLPSDFSNALRSEDAKSSCHKDQVQEGEDLEDVTGEEV